MNIQGSHFFITGGSRGIGLAVAKMAAENRAHVYVAARSFERDTEDILKALGAASVHFFRCDLSTREGVDSLIKSMEKVEVDILFNNAGALTGGLIEEQSLNEIYSMFQVNLNTLVHLTRAFIPGMVKRRRGKIINNSSVSAFMHFPCASTYAASKAGLRERVRLFDGRHWVDGNPGDFLYVPEGGIHAFRNESGEPASMLIHFAPGAPREGYFEGLARFAVEGQPDKETLERFYAEHDNTWV